MTAKLNRKEVLRRLNALGVQPANQQYVLRKLGLEVHEYGDGGPVADPPAADTAPGAPTPGNLYPVEAQIPGESLAHRILHIPGYFLDYLRGSGDKHVLPISDVDASGKRLSDFTDVAAILQSRKPGRYSINTTESLPTDFPESGYLGHVNHNLSGQLQIGNDGRYTFNGALTVGRDRYKMNAAPYRTWLGEASTTVGRALGRASTAIGQASHQWKGSQPFDVDFEGSKPFAERGQSPLPRKAKNAPCG